MGSRHSWVPNTSRCRTLAAFVSTDDEQDAKHSVARETIDLVPGCAWQEESPADEGATGVGRCPRRADAAEASGWRVLGHVIWVRVLVFEEARRGQGEESPGRQGDGAIVDVDVEPRKEMGRKVSREACSVTAILDESTMKSLTLGKK